MIVKCEDKSCKNNKNNECSLEFITIFNSCEGCMCSNYIESKESKQFHYEINWINHEIYDYIVFSQDYMGCGEYLNEIAEDIVSMDEVKTHGKVVNVLIDNILHNGNESNRYFTFSITNNEIKKDSFNVVYVPKLDELRRISAEYYKDKEQLINSSVLVSVQKKMLLKGLPI